MVYLYKYKIKKDDDWKIGISGIQPSKKSEVSTDISLVKLTDKKIKTEEPIQTQFNEQLKKLLFAKHKSGQRFYEKGSLWDYADGGYEE